ncbi:MAG: VOC family protein [Gemmatimonadaceae bacterium]
MSQSLCHVSMVVRDYDEAIAFFAGTLGFEVEQDVAIGQGRRWVLVRPRGDGTTSLLLARADTPEQEGRIGNQTGGRVFLFLHTDDFWRDYEELRARGVHFLETPRTEVYGTVAVFEDLYRNKWDLIQRKTVPSADHV